MGFLNIVLRNKKMYATLRNSFLVLALLWGPAAFADPVDTVADTVLGQPNFTSGVVNNGGLSASSLFNATDVVVDANGNAYVADARNNRVLIYLDPKNTDTVADFVLGQPDFVSNTCNSDGSSPSASTLCDPQGVALDTAGNLYVADWQNSRILVYLDPLNDQVADVVIGQPDFTSIAFNGGGLFPTASTLFTPLGVTVDNGGNVFIADTSNNRVTVYFDPLNSDTIADMVLGQPDFISNMFNNGGVSTDSLALPTDVKVDVAGNVFVADTSNNRILVYNDLINSTNVSADSVFGQPDFTSSSANNGGVSASSLSNPSRIAIDALGNIYIGDSGNNRVLEYHTPLTSDTVADVVLGQPDFTSSAGNTTDSSLTNPEGVALDTDGDIYVADRANSRVLIFEGTPPVTTTVLTGICFDPPFDMPLSLKKNSKRVIPLKMTLLNSEGVEVTESDLSSPPVVNVLFNGQVYGEVPPDGEDLLPTGGANNDNIFRFSGGKWIYNLDTGQFASPGEYVVKAVAGDGSYTIDGCMETFERLD